MVACPHEAKAVPDQARQPGRPRALRPGRDLGGAGEQVRGDRALWDEYTKAYEDALARTSTRQAPWYVVPADKKWYRNLVIATILVEALETLEIGPPEPAEVLTGVVIE